MRVFWKLSVIVLLGGMIQCALVRWANDIDDAAFVFRVLVARIEGREPDDPRLVREAHRLLHRRCARAGLAPAGEPGMEEIRLASAPDT